MLFNSLTFIVFFAIVLFLHVLPFRWKLKKANLLVASYLFYAAWNPPLVVLLWISTVVDWVAGGAMHKTDSQARRRMLLGVSLVANLGLLGFFKYGGFLLESFVVLMHAMGFDYNPAKPGIILPMGISFYTFQTITYTFDIYRKQLKPAKSFLDYALYVTFFPQLVAGPIVRAAEFLPQLAQPRRATSRQLLYGLWLMTLGLFMKIVVADGLLSDSSDAVFSAEALVSSLDAWMGAMAFSGQIFCDFAGYSLCAIGSALCLGFVLPDNFRFPYAAKGFSDFWRRWHVTLSTWLRDYLYIPLGGNRVTAPRLYANLMVVMLLGGLWHGAAWTFVAWGALHGIYLCGERLLRNRFGNVRWTQTTAGEVAIVAATFVFVLITWVPFRAGDFATAARVLYAMTGIARGGEIVLPTLGIIKVSIVTIWILAAHWLLRHSSHESLVEKMPWWLVSFAWAVMLILIILMQGGSDAFIYFQF